MSDDRPLPYGWVKEWDSNYQQHFYVDTKAQPPRSIWVHPYEDEQYLREHPEVREKIGNKSFAPPQSPPPASTPGGGSSQRGGPSSSDAANVPNQPPLEKGKRSFLGKLKDKAIGTKEEREASRLAEQRMIEEHRRRAQAARQQNYGPQGYHDPRMNSGYGAPGYGRGQGGQYYPQQNYSQAQPPPRSSRSGFGGGMAMPILGGLAGGLLLGEALDGFGDGGDGGDDGGDFGGDF